MKKICNDDSCDLGHCGKCNRHTRQGTCQDCQIAADDDYQRKMETEWALHKAGMPSVFDQ